MKTMRLPVAFVAIQLLACSLFARGAGSMQQPPTPRTPGERAVISFNDGIKARENAWKLEKELETQTDPGRRTKLEAKIRKTYESAVRSQLEATRLDPTLFQAYGELGYAYRKSGNYTAALEAYDHALTMQPNYGQAIEYRAEAYLGLGRTAEAQEAYMVLFNGGDKADAEALGASMKKWVDEHRTNPGDVSPEKVDQLAKWLSDRKEISSQSASATGSWK